MEDAAKKQDRRKGMKRWKEKRSSRSSGNLGTLTAVTSQTKIAKPKTPKGKHTRSSSGSLSSRAGVFNLSVPPLQLDTPTKKVSSTGKKYRSHKGNAGFKSRCTDQERWHQYLVDEANFREPNYACPFAFVGRQAQEPKTAPTDVAQENGESGGEGQLSPLADQTSPPEEVEASAPPAVPLLDSVGKLSASPRLKPVADGSPEVPKSPVGEKAMYSPKGSPKRQKKDYTKRQPSLLRELCVFAPRTLSMLNDNVTVVNNVVQYQSLEQFGVKKFNIAEMNEWEAALHESIERYFLERDKGKSLKNKVREKSLGVISGGTPRSRSRSRTATDLEKKGGKPSGQSAVTAKEIQYGGLKTSINPLLLIDSQDRSRSARPRSKRSSTYIDKSAIELPDSPFVSDTEAEPTDRMDSPSVSPRQTQLSTVPREEAMPTRSTSKEKKDQRTFINLLGTKSPRKGEDESQFAVPKRSASAKISSPMASPSSSATYKFEALLGLSVNELPQQFIPAGAGQSLSAAETIRAEEDESAVGKSISPLRLFSPRKKGKRVPLSSSGSYEDVTVSPVTTPKGEQSKKKRPGYFQSLKMQLKTPRGAKGKDDEEAMTHPRKRKSRVKSKKGKDVVIQRIESSSGMVTSLPRPLSSDEGPSSPARDSEPESPTSSSPEGHRPHSASFDVSQGMDDNISVDALVYSGMSMSARSNRFSLPIRRAQSRASSSKSDTEAGLFRSPTGLVRFESEELNPPSDHEED